MKKDKSNDKMNNVIQYFHDIASLLDNETVGKMLADLYKKLRFSDDTALYKYLNPGYAKLPLSNKEEKIDKPKKPLFFPFGCNNSQYKAVEEALSNQLSIIQGPPGTGKTQTILNIIANILLSGKTVMVVSGNNSATENVKEKLEEEGLSFLVAALGNLKNKEKFLNTQEEYPDFNIWDDMPGECLTDEQVIHVNESFKAYFTLQDRLCNLKNEKSALKIEHQHFEMLLKDRGLQGVHVKTWFDFNTDECIALCHRLEVLEKNNIDIGFIQKLKFFMLYGIYDSALYKYDIGEIITVLQGIYYQTKIDLLNREIESVTNELKSLDTVKPEEFRHSSMKRLKLYLKNKYSGRGSRIKFSVKPEEKAGHALNNVSDRLLFEYPIITSTTYTAVSTLQNVVYDYVIIDEASQVDVVSGALALSCARNAVIVGDVKQLPNVITNDMAKKVEALDKRYDILPAYRYANSLLQSVSALMTVGSEYTIPQTLLKEHYRCHPKIIDFCNKRFYNNELLIMTDDSGEEDTLKVYKSNKGNHARKHYSQRQIDIINEEIIPYNFDKEMTYGIVTPYNNQVKEINQQIENGLADTVHKYQGREKDIIIISTVDDAISDFADDPNLLNVAVSRAKKRLIVVVTGNEIPREKNIAALIDYIQYNNCEVVESKVNSIFDYLYLQYRDLKPEKRRELKSKYSKRLKQEVTQFSEELMAGLICDVLDEEVYGYLDFVAYYPLNHLFKDFNLMSEEELRFVRNSWSHVDFLIFDRTSHKPVLGIEVNGYVFHENNPEQERRDRMKNDIFRKYDIPLMTFLTNGSGEREKLKNALSTIV